MSNLDVNNSYLERDYTELNDKLLYIDYVLQNYEYEIINIEPITSYRFQGNFFGLLRELNIGSNLFLTAMYINGLTSPIDFDGTLRSIKVPVNPPIPKR